MVLDLNTFAHKGCKIAARERCFVSRMQDFYIVACSFDFEKTYCPLYFLFVLTYTDNRKYLFNLKWKKLYCWNLNFSFNSCPFIGTLCLIKLEWKESIKEMLEEEWNLLLTELLPVKCFISIFIGNSLSVV